MREHPDGRTPTSLYRVLFQGQDEQCELYAVRVAQGHLPAFLEIEQIVFAERAAGPFGAAGQERLRTALAEAKRCYTSLARIVRIDEIAYESLSERRETANPPGEDARSKVAALRAGVPRPK